MRVIRQSRAGVDIPIAAEQTTGVILLKWQPPGIDPLVTLGATGLVAMPFQLLPQRQMRSVILRQGRNIGRRIVRQFGDDLASQPCAAFDGVGFAAIREPGEN